LPPLLPPTSHCGCQMGGEEGKEEEEGKEKEQEEEDME
jgi:hypothetical protein